MRFWKYHGLGNDFVLVDWRGRADPTPAVTRAVCDRHFGVGADGIAAWLEGEGGRPFMRVFNADGSVADMCGNGLRCFVRWLIDVHGFPAEPLVVGSDAGDQWCIPEVDSGGVWGISVDLGPARYEGPCTLTAKGRQFEGHASFLGNPHFVMLRAPGAEPADHGRSLSTHAWFPAGTNVEWLEVRSRSAADVTVYERGCGLTRACGTGGAGAVEVGVRLGRLDADVPIRVTQPGGELTYLVEGETGNVWMTGPAEAVFEGRTALL